MTLTLKEIHRFGTLRLLWLRRDSMSHDNVNVTQKSMSHDINPFSSMIPMIFIIHEILEYWEETADNLNAGFSRNQFSWPINRPIIKDLDICLRVIAIRKYRKWEIWSSFCSPMEVYCTDCKKIEDFLPNILICVTVGQVFPEKFTPDYDVKGKIDDLLTLRKWFITIRVSGATFRYSIKPRLPVR